MSDYSWIDTWGMNDQDANYYNVLNGSSTAGDYSPISQSDWDLFMDFGVDPYGYTQGADGGWDLSQYISDWSPDASSLSGMSLSQLATLAGKVMGGQKTGNELLDSLVGMVGGAAGLYGNLQNLDWMDMLSDTRGVYSDLLKDVKGYTPYAGQEVADLTAAQKQGIGYAPDMLSKGNQMFLGSGTYDPNQLETYLNPYTEGALATANRLTSQNLTENILPTINSTFTGQGQFGSTRNAEFQNRAIRDTQQAIADANSKGMVGAYGQASQDYMKMLGQQGTIGQQALQAGMGLAGQEQAQNQATLTGALDAWKRNQTMPMEQFKSLTSGIGSFNPAGSSNTLSGLSSLFGA